jgi:nucleotide-binding universal stress UspA family protein
MSENATDRILAAVSFSRASLAALGEARRLAVKLGAVLDVLHVWQLPKFPLDLETDGNVRRPRPSRPHRETREGGYSFVFLGATPHRGWRRVLPKRVARGVMRRAPCSVVCVRASEPKHPAGDARQPASP